MGNYKIIDELNNNIYVFNKAGEHYLAYTADSGRTIDLHLAGNKNYTLQIIDTWISRSLNWRR